MQIAHGPLSIVIGLAAGILLGSVCALTPVWSTPPSRAAALVVMGELMAFCGSVHKSHLINGTDSVMTVLLCLPGFSYQNLTYVTFEGTSAAEPFCGLACRDTLHSAALCYAMLCCAVLCCATLRYAALHYATLCYATTVSCCVMLCHVMPCHAMSCHAMLCHVRSTRMCYITFL